MISALFNIRTILVIAVLALIFAVVAPMLAPTIPNSSGSEPLTDEELMAIWGTAGVLSYQVDVYITGAHAADHATSSAAMRCASQKGNVMAVSEKGSRDIHLICWDKETRTMYDVIITRINRWVASGRNYYSYLKTAYAPLTDNPAYVIPKAVEEAFRNGDKMGQINWYVQHLVETVNGKVVGLYFDPMELMFIPGLPPR